MRITEILRLHELGMSQRDIALSSGGGKSTVGSLLKLCKDKGVTHATAAAMSDDELHMKLYPESATKRLDETAKRMPDWDVIHEELVKRKVNLQFVWEEYKDNALNPLSYSRFCKHYREYRESSGKTVSLHNERKAGEIMEVDWIGDTLDCVIDDEGEIFTAHFFVSILGYSEMPYVEAFPDEKEMSWITANVNALHFYGGVPRIITPDNCKTAVKTPRYYEAVINSAYWELAQHYEVAILPARSRKPKDKAVVEQSVGWLETWLLGRLRTQRFHSFAELNKAIRLYMEQLVARRFQKRDGSRAENFFSIDKPALRPLPPTRYEIADVVFRRVGDNYHVGYDGFWYSVPYIMHQEQVVVRATSHMIEILDKDHVRVASHKRRYTAAEGRYSSNVDHMPPHHQAVQKQREYDGSRYRVWADAIGKNTRVVIEMLLTGNKIEEQGYRSCMGVLQFAKTYGKSRLENACKRARELNSPTYTTIRDLLKNNLESKPLTAPEPTPEHDNIRGGEYYN